MLTRTVAGVRFTLEVPPGWANGPIIRRGEDFRSGGLLVSKSIRGPQGAEGVVFWTSFPHAEQAQACSKIIRNERYGSPADLAAGVASAPGTRLVRGPSNTRLGGRSATYVELEVRRDLGCDPGYFFSWRAQCWGACWVATGVGDRIKTWIVAVRGELLFFEAETNSEATAGLHREIQQIVDSIRFVRG